ncbi:hypothetical protein AUP68_06258 [Ilyonectria robusta]
MAYDCDGCPEKFDPGPINFESSNELCNNIFMLDSVATRQAPDPATTLQPSNVAGISPFHCAVAAESEQQKQVTTETARSAGRRPTDFGVNSASQPKGHQGSAEPVIQQATLLHQPHSAEAVSYPQPSAEVFSWNVYAGTLSMLMPSTASALACSIQPSMSVRAPVSACSRIGCRWRRVYKVPGHT